MFDDAERIPIRPLTFANVTESVNVSTMIPISVSATDSSHSVPISGFTVSSATDNVVLIRHNTAYERVTEDGDSRVTEDGDIRYTEEEY